MAILSKMKPPTSSRPTGRANALTRGQGKKIGLKRQYAGPPQIGSKVTTNPIPPTRFYAGGSEGIGSKLTIAGKQPTASTGPRPGESLGDWGDRKRREGGFTGVPSKTAPSTRPGWAEEGIKKLTGRANALTRGRGKKLGLRKPASIAARRKPRKPASIAARRS